MVSIILKIGRLAQFCDQNNYKMLSVVSSAYIIIMIDTTCIGKVYIIKIYYQTTEIY